MLVIYEFMLNKCYPIHERSLLLVLIGHLSAIPYQSIRAITKHNLQDKQDDEEADDEESPCL
jgi:hypothetical protein